MLLANLEGMTVDVARPQVDVERACQVTSFAGCNPRTPRTSPGLTRGCGARLTPTWCRQTSLPPWTPKPQPTGATKVHVPTSTVELRLVRDRVTTIE